MWVGVSGAVRGEVPAGLARAILLVSSVEPGAGEKRGLLGLPQPFASRWEGMTYKDLFIIGVKLT